MFLQSFLPQPIEVAFVPGVRYPKHRAIFVLQGQLFAVQQPYFNSKSGARTEAKFEVITTSSKKLVFRAYTANTTRPVPACGQHLLQMTMVREAEKQLLLEPVAQSPSLGG